ncbi:ABC transporter permease [Corynebacterium amycolatum]|uniref:ABC transporter permease n=1 Tax=Corynebacterium amycolatum TaxID=43765 RepID=UPI001CCD7452|nr:ABC transporter permease [Corynebacterium amycolatum]MCA0443750.1 ABC transporter permease [Corynebacterium amycolatum]MDC7117204.1 ABC transporter permease [Corynebacterium amycolatum]MEB2596232.1 ABC transporter permease [Corynebacterium amycolatum]UVE00474.1 ABC transporter permease [Corynebacterium amycolatum]
MIDAIFVHLRRIAHIWLRRPDFWFMTFIAPLVYLFIVNRMFGGLVRQLTGEFELRNAVILVVTAWAFILAITGSSTVFVERSNGFHERLITMPSPYAAVPAARIIAEFIRIMAMTVVVAAVAALLSDGPSEVSWWWRIAVTGAMVATAAACTGTYIAFSITSPQGSVALIPLIIVAMFVNTVLMPADHFRPLLRGIAGHTPVSAAGEAVNGTGAAGLVVCAAWFLGIAVLAAWGIAVKTRPGESA